MYKDREDMGTLERRFNELWKEYTQLNETIINLNHGRGAKAFIQRRIKLKSLYNEKSDCFYKLRAISDQITEQEKQEQEQKKVCEECKCSLDNKAGIRWGLGYVCTACDKLLRVKYDEELQKSDIEKEEPKKTEEDFGECEECHCKLDYMPSASWGVGYICISCAKTLRGEYE